MTTPEDIGRELGLVLRDKIEGIPAVIGRDNGGGSYTVTVSGRENYVYVRLYGLVSQTVEAKNLKTQYIANLGVKVRKNSDKEYEVLGVDPTIGGIYLGDMLAAANVPPQGELNSVILPDEQFKPFRCRPSDAGGWVGWIELGVYGDAMLGGTSFDATAAALISSTEKCWIVVSLNTTTNVPTVSQGTIVTKVQPLQVSDIFSVSYPAGDLRLWAFLIYGSDLALPTDPARSISLRPYFELGGGTMSTFDIGADTGTDETVDDGEVVTFAGGSGLTTAVSATNTITTSYNITALTEETSLDEANDLFLMYDGGAGTYKKIKGENLPGGSGVFIPAGTRWTADAAPASPSASDDEFADASGGVPTGWTEMDFDTTLAVAEQAYGLELTATSTAATVVAGVYKALPAGNFSIWTKVSILYPSDTLGAGTAFKCGIALFQDATSNTGDMLVHGYDLGAGPNINAQALTHTAYNAAGSTVAVIQTDDQLEVSSTMYFRIRFDGTNYILEFSYDGISIQRIASTTLGYTPAHMGVYTNNLNTTFTSKAVFQFFRYAASDVGLVPMNGRRIDYYA